MSSNWLTVIRGENICRGFLVNSVSFTIYNKMENLNEDYGIEK